MGGRLIVFELVVVRFAFGVVFALRLFVLRFALAFRFIALRFVFALLLLLLFAFLLLAFAFLFYSCFRRFVLVLILILVRRRSRLISVTAGFSVPVQQAFPRRTKPSRLLSACG